MKTKVNLFVDRLTVEMMAESPEDAYHLALLKEAGVDVRLHHYVPTGNHVVAEFSVDRTEIRPGDCHSCYGRREREGGCPNAECDKHGR